jgi:hypothetical protein
MAIITAVQKGSLVVVYGERNSIIAQQPGTLHGYTSTTYSVKQGDLIVTRNEKGQIISQQRG